VSDTASLLLNKTNYHIYTTLILPFSLEGRRKFDPSLYREKLGKE